MEGIKIFHSSLFDRASSVNCDSHKSKSSGTGLCNVKSKISSPVKNRTSESSDKWLSCPRLTYILLRRTYQIPKILIEMIPIDPKIISINKV